MNLYDTSECKERLGKVCVLRHGCAICSRSGIFLFALEMLCVCEFVVAELSNHKTNFDEIWYEHYAIGGIPNYVIFNSLHSVITTWWTDELVRREHQGHHFL